MHSNRHTIITVSLALLALGFSVLASNHALAQNCTPVSGTTVIITTSCTVLDIDGDGSNVTINSGVTIDNSTGSAGAVETSNSTNTTIINNGIISATISSGLRSNPPGFITNLINNGTISAGLNFGLRNGGTITSLINTGIGIISAENNQGIEERLEQSQTQEG